MSNIVESCKHANVLLYFGPHPMTSQNCPEGPYFEIDSFWRRLLSNSGVLVTTYVFGLDVGDQAPLEMRTQMLQVAALDSLRGDRKREIFQFEPFIGGNREEFGAIAALYAVIALLQLAMPDTLSILRESLRASLSALPYPLPLKDEVVPPNFRISCWSVDRIVVAFSRFSAMQSFFLCHQILSKLAFLCILAIPTHVEASLLFETVVSGVELLPTTIDAIGLVFGDCIKPPLAVEAVSN